MPEGRVVRSPFLQQVGTGSRRYAIVFERTKAATIGLTTDEFDALCRHRPASAISLADLREAVPASADFFLGNRLFLPEGTAERRTSYRVLEVEINRHCNFRCTFCPVSTRPHPRAFMEDAVFSTVLDRAAEFGIRGVSLNHYSEPTLHPKLVDHMHTAVDRGHWIRLCTNASLLDEDKIQAIARLGAVYMQINLPSADESGFSAATGAGPAMFDRVMRNLDQVVALEIRGELVVNWTDTETRPQLREIKERFGGGSLRVVAWRTDSRAGVLHHVGRQVDHTGQLLTGCNLADDQLQVTWKGDVFLCCQDFEQRTTFGNLLDQSLADIVDSDAFVQTRRYILGLEPTPPELLCNRCEHTRVQSSTGHPEFGARPRIGRPDRISISPAAHAAGFTAAGLRMEHRDATT